MALRPFARLARAPTTSPTTLFAATTATTPTLPSRPNPSVFEQRRSKHDRNRNRGVSVIRRTGYRPRQTFAISVDELPRPVLDPARRPKVQVDEKHGLWGFFHPEKKLLHTPEEDAAHGRSWTVQELRSKSWEDLHGLWWVCTKERNRLATEAYERKRIDAGYGDYEAQARDETIRKTMKNIKHTLTERWYAWENARQDALADAEVDLSGTGQAYKPSYNPTFEEDEVDEASALEAQTAQKTAEMIANEDGVKATGKEQIAEDAEKRAELPPRQAA